jgi:hypothetical protein
MMVDGDGVDGVVMQFADNMKGGLEGGRTESLTVYAVDEKGACSHNFAH